MKIYVSEEDKVGNRFQFGGLEYRCSELDIQIQSLEQHEQEIRKQERQKVIAELEECFELKDLEAGIIQKYSMIDLKQKLNEMKEV